MGKANAKMSPFECSKLEYFQSSQYANGAGSSNKNSVITDFSISNILKHNLKSTDNIAEIFKEKQQNTTQERSHDMSLKTDTKKLNLAKFNKKVCKPVLNHPIASPWIYQMPLVYNIHRNKCLDIAIKQDKCISDCNNNSKNIRDNNFWVNIKEPSTPAKTLHNIGDDIRLTPEIKVTEQNCNRRNEICQKEFVDEKTLKLQTSCQTVRYWCAECTKGFSQLRNFRYHVSMHRGTGEFRATCPECGKNFNDRGYLSSHMKIHRNRKEYACTYCPKSFNQRVAYNMHVRIHTGHKPHKCNDCGKSFSRKMLLRQHSRTHSGEKPYQCPQCRKPFADRSNMTLHLRLHSGVKPFSCTLCTKSFSKKHHLKTHLNYHTGCKPYQCPHQPCAMSFSQSSNMRTHAKKCTHNENRISR